MSFVLLYVFCVINSIFNIDSYYNLIGSYYTKFHKGFTKFHKEHTPSSINFKKISLCLLRFFVLFVSQLMKLFFWLKAITQSFTKGWRSFTKDFAIFFEIVISLCLLCFFVSFMSQLMKFFFWLKAITQSFTKGGPLIF